MMVPKLGWAVLPFALALGVQCRGDTGGQPEGSGSVAVGAQYRLRSSRLKECEPSEHAPRGGRTRRVGVEVELEPTGDAQVPANPYYATLVDGTGSVYEATLGGCGPGLAPTLPTRGRPARGWLVFEVPRSASRFTLTYTPELVGMNKEELQLPLAP